MESLAESNHRHARAISLPIWFLVGVGSLVAVMATARADQVPVKLVGTRWRWVHFASPAENFSVVEPERYTLVLEGSRARTAIAAQVV